MSRPVDRFINVQGHRTRYWQAGESVSTVVLLHGIACSVIEWEKNVDALSATHRLFAVDILGYGLTDKPADGPYDMVGLAGFLLEFMTAVGIERAHIVGNSMGARLALECAARAAGRTASLVLAAPAGVDRTTLLNFRLASIPILGELLTRPSKFGIRGLWRLGYFNPDLVSDAFVEEKLTLAKMPGAGPAFMKTLRGLVGFGGFRTQEIARFHERVRRVRAPALVIWGKQDQVLPVAHLAVLKELMPHAESQVLDQCGHVPMLERPSDFNRMALAFIDRQDAATPS